MEAGPGVAERAAEKRESEHTDQTKETGRKKKKEREKNINEQGETRKRRYERADESHDWNRTNGRSELT